MKDLGIFGGTFDPPHFLHLLVGQRAAEQFGLSKVLYIPSGNPPHKKEGVLPGEKRFEMIDACTRENPLFEASRLEIDRPGITWSIDTLYELKKIHGDDTSLSFIIGEDNLSAMEGYDRKDEFLSLARLLVSPRHSTLSARKRRSWARKLGVAELNVIDCPPIPFSSSLLRNWVAKGRSIEYLTPPAVRELIEKYGYYRQGVNPCTAKASSAVGS